MKKKTFFIFFIGLNFTFICLFIDKQTRISKLYYQKQALGKIIKKIQSEKLNLITHLIYKFL